MPEKTAKSNNKKLWLLIVGIMLVCVAIVCIILFLIQGQTTVSGNFEGNGKAEYLTCESRTTPYSLFDYDDSDSKNLKITATFENDKLSGVSLIYKLKYNDAEKLDYSSARNHAAVNKISQKEGLGPDPYTAKYTKTEDTLQLTMMAQGEDITNKTLKYFMLKGQSSGTPYTQDKVSKMYAEQGLKCEKHK